MEGEVRVSEKQEYGRMEIDVEVDQRVFGDTKVGDRQNVWMSPGDEATRLPEGFQVVASSKQGAIAAVQNQANSIYGLQYHPEADEIFIRAIKDAGIYDSIWKAFAVFMPVLTVGVQGDQRTHSYAITLRAVTSQDGMTADWFYFDHKFLVDLSTKICNEVPGVNRVLLGITSKPPSTIEWE